MRAYFPVCLQTQIHMFMLTHCLQLLRLLLATVGRAISDIFIMHLSGSLKKEK